jgi:phospholipase/carboxylesterase
MLETIEIETHLSCNASIIWMHGLGADGHDFESIVPELGLPEQIKLRFIFPHAPLRPITLNNNYVMRAWYDIIAIGPGAQEDGPGLEQMSHTVGRLIEQEHQRGIPYERIILAGFSQGGAMALYTGLRYPHKLAGILALSTYLPVAQTTSAQLSEHNKNISIFMAHGTLDLVVPLPFGEYSYQMMRRLHLPVQWKTYPMAHGLVKEELIDIRQHIIAMLPDL